MGSGLTSTRYRIPIAWTRRRTSSSGLVSRPRFARITARLAGLLAHDVVSPREFGSRAGRGSDMITAGLGEPSGIGGPAVAARVGRYRVVHGGCSFQWAVAESQVTSHMTTQIVVGLFPPEDCGVA